MLKTKNNIFLIALMLMIICSSAFLFACGHKDNSINISVGEHGEVIHIKNEIDEGYYAKPEQWYTFVGWFDGYKKYSENPSLKVTASTPKNLEARFATTGLLTFDRILNSLYNTYLIGLNESGDYFNFVSNGQFKYSNGEKEIEYSTSLDGFLSFNGNGSQLSLKLDNADETNSFSFIYNDNSENGYIYLNNGGEKRSYKDLGLLTNMLRSLPSPSENVWSIKNILNDENSFNQFDQYFGLLNASGIVENVINTENHSKLVLNFQKLLNQLRNFYPLFKENSFKKLLADILITNYKSGSFPKVSITINVDYLSKEREQISKIEIDVNLAKDYLLNFAGKTVVLPKGNFNFKIDNLNYSFSQEPNKVKDEEINSYPENDYNLVNFHLGGELSFVDEETSSVIDSYSVELDADLNPFALAAFKDEKLNEIEWEKLGFLSFRVVLNLSDDPNEALEQNKRHKNTTDYINILIDTKKLGPKVLVYSAFYDPSTLLTTSYFINNSFDLAMLFNVTPKQEAQTEPLSGNNESENRLSKLIRAIIELCINIDSNNLNQSFYDMLSKLLENSQILKNNVSLTENGIKLNLGEIRDFIRNKEIEIGLTLGGKPIKTDQYLFGDDNISCLVLNFEDFEYESVRRNIDGYYVDNEGKSYVEEYNKKHLTLVGINEISFLSSLNLEAILNLKNTIITADSGKFSDGTIKESYLSNKGKDESIRLYVKEVSTKQVNEKIEITLSLFIQAPYNDPNLLDTTLSDVLFKNFNITYGFYYYTFEI